MLCEAVAAGYGLAGMLCEAVAAGYGLAGMLCEAVAAGYGLAGMPDLLAAAPCLRVQRFCSLFAHWGS
jgi:hypothetical protein